MIDGLDPSSSTWRAVSEWATAQIEGARDSLESVIADGPASNVLRGRIQALRELLALDRPQPSIPEAVDYLPADRPRR